MKETAKQDLNFEELLAKFSSAPAAENIDWVAENPREACRLLWYLLGHARQEGRDPGDRIK